MNDFLSWQEAYRAGPNVCGGKGYNLARLARYGFRVPRGGVLPVGAPLSAIRQGMERLGFADAKVAVRSSATAEDGARASFAGIHRSFLNVRGAEAIEQAAQGCIDSLQTPEAIAYRRRMGFRDEEVRCAVVICEMVEARSAGVAFSCDPATGRRDVVVIDAAEGLGEAVVSGRVNPQHAVWQSRSSIFRREEGSAPGTLLPPAIEEELAHQARRAQWALGEGRDPQDIEWAYDGERLWLLQARPVTRLPRAGWPETARMPRHWSTANLKDNQPAGWCELSWSALHEVVGDALYATLTAVGYPLPPGMEVVRRFHGRGFFDLTAMQ
ncbi:MAG TPA: PEP/pyruvate-binding domain-containing protein, partial [Candidatus Sulfopaludibacter sp.]|nr:PEP/pyruvate-binding domain-containing protein [Candidatus Sulfopaludibacter sp.]